MEVMVTVVTAAFNHEPYIAKTMESIVKQNTNFKFEYIVHDDCSTDQTTEIIRQYAEKYPDIIRPMYESENQYSKGVDITRLMAGQARGKYFALCEGDDYWCDVNKLQKQVDFLESHPEYSACVHNTKILNTRSRKVSYINDAKEAYDLAMGEIVKGGIAAFHMSSVLTKRELILKSADVSFIKEMGSDYTVSMFLRTEGKIHYLPDVMSVYRRFTPGSWTSKRINVDKRIDEIHWLRVNKVLALLDQYTNGEYKDVIDPVIVRNYQRVLDGYPLMLRMKLKLRTLPGTWKLSIMTFGGKIKRNVFHMEGRYVK